MGVWCVRVMGVCECVRVMGVWRVRVMGVCACVGGEEV